MRKNFAMNKLLNLCVFLLFANFGFSQNYTVAFFQKINDIQGGFSDVLNDQDNFGVSIDQIGDLDGNGVNDVVVGAFLDDDGGSNRGAVWILFLDLNDQVISQTKISNTRGGFNGVLNNGDGFGSSVAYLGDINNDGLIELAVGAEYDEDGGYGHGAVWILSLNSDGTVNSHAKISDTEGNFNGFINDSAIFGSDIENIGDLNGDGVDDLVIGSREDDDGGDSNGAIWVIFLNPDLTVNYFQKISELEGGFNETLADGDFFGSSIADIGDLNGDGVVDLAVGSTRDDDVFTNSGSIYILFLNINGTVNNYTKISNNYGGLSNLITSNGLFGESIDGVVDIDNDGKIEIVVGAMNQINPSLISLGTGAFFIIELNADGTVSEEHFYTFRENCFLEELSHGVLFGGSVSFLTMDPNNLKIAVGSYRDSENGNRKGAIYILTLGEVSYNLVSFTDPTGCGVDDGTITLSGFSANTESTIGFNNGSDQLVTVFSDSAGLLTITGLPGGLYTDITVNPDLSDCSFNLGNITLATTSGLSPVISSADPTNCDASNNGSITISGLYSNTSYSISFNNGSIQTINLVSSVSGVIGLTGLSSGIYTEITVDEIGGGCSYNLGQVTLASSALIATILPKNPSDCDSNNGAITITGLANTTEKLVRYEKDQSQSATVRSNNVGEINLEGLSIGSYQNITIVELLTNCSSNLGQIILNCIGNETQKCFETPKFFTPNNDGNNDLWTVELFSSEGGCDYTLYIYDRFGKLLKTLTPQNNVWNGTYNGELMPTNDYWYYVEFINAEVSKSFRSHFTLKR